MSPRAAKPRRRSRAVSPRSRDRTRPRSAPTKSDAAPRAVVLAAGAGTRMRSTLPKVLHRVGGRTLIEAVLAAAEAVSPSRVVVVVGSGRERVAEVLSGRNVTLVVQDPPLGTGDAARRAVEALGEGGGPILI
ncbi:MAG TPA: NTP transferase domain-containing protein, partial [Thermoanaerobaculia bacterium]|nr:NTP transferase domain-containing protein [Thermoanaerobaculia bacterium]